MARNSWPCADEFLSWIMKCLYACTAWESRAHDPVYICATVMCDIHAVTDVLPM